MAADNWSWAGSMARLLEKRKHNKRNKNFIIWPSTWLCCWGGLLCFFGEGGKRSRKRPAGFSLVNFRRLGLVVLDFRRLGLVVLGGQF